MENMHLDKCGAATSLGVLKTLAETKANVNCMILLGLAENVFISYIKYM